MTNKGESGGRKHAGCITGAWHFSVFCLVFNPHLQGEDGRASLQSLDISLSGSTPASLGAADLAR